MPKRPNLFVLGSGVPIPLALAMIGPQMRGILNQATSEFDLVVVDSPPLLGCAETLESAAAADVTVLAVRSGHTPMKALATTVESSAPHLRADCRYRAERISHCDRCNLQGVRPVLHGTGQHLRRLQGGAFRYAQGLKPEDSCNHVRHD